LERLGGGTGIMIEDIAAAFATCLFFHFTVPMIFAEIRIPAHQIFPISNFGNF
jgi:hypothetical protein